jgi:hypothetical protein
MGEDEIGGACGTYGAGRKCAVRCSVNVEEINHLGMYGAIILKWVFIKYDVRAWNGLI